MMVIVGGRCGIGKALVEQLRALGHAVLWSSRQSGAAPLHLDLTVPSSVASAAAHILALPQPPHSVVFVAAAVTDELNVEAAAALFEANLFGVFALANQLCPLLRSGTRFVFVSSRRAVNTSFLLPDALLCDNADDGDDVQFARNYVASFDEADTWQLKRYSPQLYAVSKVLVNRRVARWAARCAPGERVLCACPGRCRTALAGYGSGDDRHEGDGDDDDDDAADIGSASDGARVLTWLASADALPEGTFFTKAHQLRGEAEPWR